MSAKIFDLAVVSEIFHISELHHPLSVLRVRCLALANAQCTLRRSKARSFYMWSDRHQLRGQKCHSRMIACTSGSDIRRESIEVRHAIKKYRRRNIDARKIRKRLSSLIFSNRNIQYKIVPYSAYCFLRIGRFIKLLN